jgi:DNA repair exonuclease SbcCD ATPase subunit
MAQEATPTETPEVPAPTPTGEGKQYDEAVVKELRSENAKARKRAQEAEARLQSLEDKDKSDLDKVTAERDRLKAEVEPLRAESQRLRVALDKKLPVELVDRLRGDTPEALAEDADKLLEWAKPAEPTTPPPPDFDGGARPPVAVPLDEVAQHQALVAALLASGGQAPPQ